MVSTRHLFTLVIGYSLTIAMGTSFEIAYFGLLDPLARTFAGGLYSSGEFISLVAVTLAAHFAPEKRRFETPVWLLVLGMAGLVLTVIGIRLDVGPHIQLAAVGSFLQGALRGSLIIMWFELFARLQDRGLLLTLCCSHLVSASMSFVLARPEVIGAGVVDTCLALMAPLSFILYKYAGQLWSAVPESPAGALRAWSFPWRPVSFVVAFTFVNTFARAFLPSDVQAMTVLGVVVSSVPLVAAALMLRNRPFLQIIREVSLPVLVAGCLCLCPLGNVLVAGILTNAASVLIDVFTFAALCRMSRQYRIDAVWLIGPSKAAAVVADRCGEHIGHLVASSTSDLLALAPAVVIVVPLLILVFNLFATRADIAGSWGVVPSDASGGSSPGVIPTAPIDVAMAVAREYGLTRREEDVLTLILRERSTFEIAQELFVSEATARSHIQHIYKKIGVHSRNELQGVCAGLLDETHCVQAPQHEGAPESNPERP